MKFHTTIVTTLSEHIIIVYFAFLVKNVVFEQKWFHLSKLAVFYRNQSNGYIKHYLKICYQIIFLDFRVIGSLKYKQ